VWWYVNEYGPKGRQEVVTNGKYANDATNRTHVKWLLEHGYLATTATGMVTAVAPPSIGTFHAVELKLRDWETALEQAARERGGATLTPRCTGTCDRGSTTDTGTLITRGLRSMRARSSRAGEP